MSTARTSVVVAALSALVTLVSFANQLVIARTFGASLPLDLYLQATSLPLLVSGALGGVFAYALVPALARATAGVVHPQARTGAFLLTFLAAGCAIAVVGALTAGWTLRLFRGSVSDARLEQLLPIARVAWLGAGAGVGLGFASAVLNLRGQFILPVAASAAPYAVTIPAVLVFGHTAGPLSVAWGMFAGTALGSTILLVASRRSVRVARLSQSDFAHVGEFVRSVPLTLLSVLVFSAYPSVDAYWAPRLGPANLSVVGYCQRLFVALGAVMATGPSVVLQPRLASAAARGDEAAFRADFGRGLRLALLICVPIGIALALLAGPIVRIAFERGAFARTATTSVAGLLPWMLASIPPMVCSVFAFKAIWARHDAKAAAWLGVSGPVLYFVLSGALSTRFGLAGIGAASLLTWSALGIVASRHVDRRALAFLTRGVFLRDLALLTLATATPVLLFREVLLHGWEQASVVGLAGSLAVTGVVTTVSCAWVAFSFTRDEGLRVLIASVWRR
jgi:putative peptidoglycan lipid II flippase